MSAKKIFLLLFTSTLFFTASAQYYDSTKVLQRVNAVGNDVNNLRIRGGMWLPQDTFKLAVKDSGALAYKNGNVYKYNGYSWAGVAGILPANSLQEVTSISDTTTVGIRFRRNGQTLARLYQYTHAGPYQSGALNLRNEGDTSNLWIRTNGMYYLPANGYTVQFAWPTFTGSRTITWADETGTVPVSSIGTANYLSKYTAAYKFGTSQIFDNGTNVGINTASPAYKFDVNGALAAIGGQFLFDHANTLFSVGFTGKRMFRLTSDTLDFGDIDAASSSALIRIKRAFPWVKTSFYGATFGVMAEGATYTAGLGDFDDNHAGNKIILDDQSSFAFLDNLAHDSKLGINTNNPNNSSVLDAVSTSKGFLIPRMSRAQINAISSPVVGMLAYDNGNKKLMEYTTTWVPLVDSTTAANNFATQSQLGLGYYGHTIFTPTTGGTVNLVNNQYNIINPAGALLALTVNLPSSPANNNVVYLKFTQTITTVTYANGTVVAGITSPAAGGLVVLVYDSGTTSWY